CTLPRLSRCRISPSKRYVTVASPMCGCGRTSRPRPAASRTGPMWSKNTKGPTLRHCAEGSARRTWKPSPRSRTRGTMWSAGILLGFPLCGLPDRRSDGGLHSRGNRDHRSRRVQGILEARSRYDREIRRAVPGARRRERGARGRMAAAPPRDARVPLDAGGARLVELALLRETESDAPGGEPRTPPHDGGRRLGARVLVRIGDVEAVEKPMHDGREHDRGDAEDGEAAVERVEAGEELARDRLRLVDRPHSGEDHRGVEERIEEAQLLRDRVAGD